MSDTKIGKHREDEVGSLRYSDEDCLTSERISNHIQHLVKLKHKLVTSPAWVGKRFAD